MRAAWVFLAFVAVANASNLFLESGKEYTYSTEASTSVGTMDYATHTSGFAVRFKTRIQVSGQTLNVKFENMEWTQFVGARDAKDRPYDTTQWTVADEPNPKPFSIKLNGEGLFQELTVPSGAPLFVKNIMRGWASALQINSGEIKKGTKGFLSEENLIHGDCDVTYTVTPNTIRKTLSTTTDCKKRVHKLRDDFRGIFCTKNQAPDYPSSLMSTSFFGEKQSNGKYQVNAMVSTGSFISQQFEEAGSAQMVYSNSTSKLVTVKGSSGDISVSGETITDLSYEWADAAFKWDVDRDLKAREPFFSSGSYFKVDDSAVKANIIKGITFQKTLLETLDTTPESINKAHKYGINHVLPAFYALDYATLRGIADELYADKSDSGTFKSNLFGELLANAGTTASAILVRDMIVEGKFDNDRDSARILTSVAYYIKRPNTQLVKEFEKLLTADLGRFTKMAAPLTIAHLVRMTCERAGNLKDDEPVRCENEFAAKYVQKVFAKFTAAESVSEKSELLAVLSNIRYGGQSDILKPVIYGQTNDESSVRVSALWAVGWDALMSGKGPKYFLPIFADNTLDHEIRIAALEMTMYSRPSAAEMSAIVATTYTEKDYEVVNYVYALFERYATNLDPCQEAVSDLAKYYLKYMKQYSNYETDFGFGVSKTYARQFTKEKYGYTNTGVFYVVGSHASSTPLSLGFGIGQTRMSNYHSFRFHVHLRIEGLAKAAVRKLKTIDPATWQTAELEKILQNDMNIRERPDQPIRVQIVVRAKANIMFMRSYDESDLGQDGKLGSFISNLKGLGETYSINYQRAIQFGGMTYEQPTPLGLPMAVMASYTGLYHITATVKRGNHRGLLYRDVEYDIHAFVHASRGIFVPMKEASYGVVNDRIYYTHLPRKFVIGVNPIKKELKLSITRPEYDNPAQFIRHSRTSVMVRGNNILGTYSKLQDNCPSCQNQVIISRGPDAIKSRAFLDRENQNVGSYLYGKYFDCEMDISRGNVMKNMIGAFMPYNKNPKTPYNSLVMGLAQIRTFVFNFPKNEQCGTHLRWSQSKTNPVREIEILLRGKFEPNGERLFFRGRKWFLKALIKAKGEPADRSYRVNIGYEFTPGNLENKLKVQLNRAPVAALGMEAYSACLALENKYPGFSKEFMSYDENADLSVSGKAMVQYGKGNTCAETDGEIKVAFKHSTTQEARDALKNKWYYKQCMELKATPAWSGRQGLPVSEACYTTLEDATNARKYTWNVEFVKLTNRMKALINKAQTVVKAGLLPYWDIDPETMGTESEIGPFMNIEATLKNDESAADVKVETRQGEETFNDVPLRLNWTKRLRNMKLTKTLKRLFKAKIISPCIVTSETVRSLDNVTYSYEPSSCYTLNSASCGPKPIYAVFTKKVGGPLPLAMTTMIGGHKVEMIPSGTSISVTVNGSPVSISEGESHTHTKDGVEIFKIFRWGSTYNIYSFLKVWITYDGNFAETVPAPSTRGQHCGICGNYNRNQYDEFTGKDMTVLPDAAALVADYKWQC